MKHSVIILILLGCISCTQSDIQRENEELLALTGGLTRQLEEARQMAQEAAARTILAEDEASRQAKLAEVQAEIAREQAAETARLRAEFEERLKSCN